MGRNEIDPATPLADICLVVPPFESLHHPNLGTAILKSACVARGLTARILYGGLMLAARIGHQRYDAVYESPMRVKAGDRLFRAHAYPPDQVARLPEPEPLPEDLDLLSHAIAPEIAPMLDALVDAVLAVRPKIVGLSSSFQQNLAASAIALRIKQRAPEIVTVMGGPNTAGPLSQGLAKAFPWIDHFFSGEADADFPDFCEAYLTRGERPERIVVNRPVRDMRTVFPPDYGDFFAQLRPLQASGALPEWLPRYLMAETSRGCWWGAKQHCTFCGLNAEGMNFREKPAFQAIAELDALKRWDVAQVMLTDNIMPRRYLDELMPALAAQPDRLGLFYEIKSNLSEADVHALSDGGVVAIQPGIESLSSPVLRLMRKGVSAHQNIALLRHCRAASLQVFWNILYGIPGERAEDYEATIALMPLLHHLPPPSSSTAILIDRFSPYFADPEGMGVAPIHPQPAYRSLYPAEVPTEDLAYHFVGDYRTGMLDRPDLIAALKQAIAEWQIAWDGPRVPVLELFERGGSATILDTRAVAAAPLTPLSPERHAALVALQKPCARKGMDPDLAQHADWLCERGYGIDHEGVVLSIAVQPRSQAPAGSRRAEIAA